MKKVFALVVLAGSLSFYACESNTTETETNTTETHTTEPVITTPDTSMNRNDTGRTGGAGVDTLTTGHEGHNH